MCPSIGPKYLRFKASNKLELSSTKDFKLFSTVFATPLALSPIVFKEYGKLIDSHDYVFRCNLGRVDGFEKNVGSKTSFRFVAGFLAPFRFYCPYAYKRSAKMYAIKRSAGQN